MIADGLLVDIDGVLTVSWQPIDGAPEAFARLGIWARTGDVDGDTTLDILVAADQESEGAIHEGAAYVIRGGSHLAMNQTIDLVDFGTTAMVGNVARIVPPNKPTRKARENASVGWKNASGWSVASW